MIDIGGDPDDLAAELARQRAENLRLRERAIERLRVMVALHGGGGSSATVN